MSKLSRREFMAISLTPLLPGAATLHGVAANTGGGTLNPPPLAPDLSTDDSFDGVGAGSECLSCSGVGVVTCPACDGTGMWTEASENSGLYQREAARSLGHCAWCNEWGRVTCKTCDGTGRVLF
jgi:hypothetical protein